MAKRKSRANRRDSKKYWVQSNQSSILPSQEGQQVTDVTPVNASSPVRAIHTEQEVASSSAVTNDLKKIGIVSGSIFAVLAVLSFVLPHLLD